MKRYSKSQLAKAYLVLAKITSPAKALRALAAALISQKMTHDVDFVVREISRQLQNEGTLLAEVVSARELPQSLRSQIEKLLQGLTQAEKTSLSFTTDPELIGGFVAKLPTQEIDASIASVLRRLSPKALV